MAINGQPIQATADDIDGVDDEDAYDYSTIAPIYPGITNYALNVPIGNVSAGGGVIAACIDLNNNGMFDDEELRYTRVDADDTSALISWTDPVSLTDELPDDNLFRLRLRAMELDGLLDVNGQIDPTRISCNGPGGIGEVEDHLIMALPPQTILATKTPGEPEVEVGDFLQWTLTFENQAGAVILPVDLVDWLPPLARYVPGSVRINDGTTVVSTEPETDGATMRWSGLRFEPAGQTGSVITVTYLTRIGTGKPGAELVNQTQAFFTPLVDYPVSNLASARATIGATEIFDCSTVTGRVFNDLNANGYVDDGEVGFAGVSLYSARGTQVKTDKYGRFSIPCAEMPPLSGQTYVMKVNEQTLPADCHLTTENPRAIRLTPGSMAKMNFGASCRRLVTVRLCDEAFVPGQVGLRQEWRGQMGELVSPTIPTCVRRRRKSVQSKRPSFRSSKFQRLLKPSSLSLLRRPPNSWPLRQRLLKRSSLSRLCVKWCQSLVLSSPSQFSGRKSSTQACQF